MNCKTGKTILNTIATLLPITILTLTTISKAQTSPPWEETDKLLANDGEADDHFGASAAMNGTIAVFGAPGDHDNGLVSGSAYIFDVTNGQQLFKLFPDDGSKYDQFGYSVSVSGNMAVIGAPYKDTDFFQAGAAYVFDLTTGRQLLKLAALDGGASDNFGNAVAVDGNLAVIGAFHDHDNGFRSGSVFVFDTTTGQQLLKLLPPDGEPFDLFGNSVAISGNLAIIGVPDDDDNGSNSGSAWVYDLTTGQQLFKLLPDNGYADDHFGISVAMNDNYAVIGASNDMVFGELTGSAYVFDVTTGRQLFRLSSPDGEKFDRFGASVAISENIAVVGAPFSDGTETNSGSAYVFNAATGQLLFKIVPTDGSRNDEFSNGIGIDGNLMVFGAAYTNNRNGRYDAGSAYIFQQRISDYLTVEPFPLRAGELAAFSLVEGLPDETTWLLYSIDGLGHRFISQLNVIVDLRNPKIALGPGLTDSNGDRQVIRRIPTITEPTNIWFQVVQQNNVTNFFRTQITP